VAAGLSEAGASGAAGAEAHALAVIEFGDVLELIAEKTTSEPGRRQVLSLRPWKEPSTVREALLAADEMVTFLVHSEGWAPPPIPDVGACLKRLETEGSVLLVADLEAVLVLLVASRRVRADLRAESSSLPRIFGLTERLPREPGLEDRLVRALDPAGGIADGASSNLRRIRRSLRGSRSAIVRRLESFMRSLPRRLQVPDASVTVRVGRYCVPIRREGLSSVGGIVHDESATHRTVFVEPPVVIPSMNRIAELEREEVREVQCILRELTEDLRPHAPALQSALGALGELDSLYARARYALAHGGSRPIVIAGRGELYASDGAEASEELPDLPFRAVDALHPLLQAGGEPVVPFDLQLRAGESVLLVSGPNAGGKTVLLKAIGLLSAMAQSGIIPPVGRGTQLPLFRQYFAIIGDEQSIQASLSTFSAQVAGLRLILESADQESLVLIDELGGSTDPAEGAALAAAVLLRLAEQGGLTVATTHLGELKELAAEESAIVNASLQFDTRALRPSFRLQRDRPGRSYALEIASRLGLPDAVLSEARSRLSGEEREMERLLGELEKKEEELSRLTAESQSARRRLREREEQVVGAAERLHRREMELEREAIDRAEKYLLKSRREVAELIDRLRDEVQAAEADPRAEPERVEQAFRTARVETERLLRQTRERRPAAASDATVGMELAVGDRVRSKSLGVEGRVAELRADEVVLESGVLRFTLRPGDLETPDGRQSGSSAPVSPPPLPELVARPEVDLRGLRVEEVEGMLAPALDAAVVGDLPSLRIIHGKGTGALRDEVRRLLESDSRISRFRGGGFDEGGSGVTVVEF
jgi:DNA mismatch repair protein MutS2